MYLKYDRTIILVRGGKESFYKKNSPHEKPFDMLLVTTGKTSKSYQDRGSCFCGTPGIKLPITVNFI